MHGATCFRICLALLATIAAATAQPIGSVQFAAAGFAVAENGTNARVVVRRTLTFGPAFTVSLSTSDGSARAGVDYVAANRTVTMPSGVTNVTVLIRVLTDNQYEGVETFTVRLSNPTGGATLGEPSEATVSILDNQSIPPGTLDTGFDPGSGFNGTVDVCQVSAGDRILVGGLFTEVNGVPRIGLVRLRQDGSVDPAFDTVLGPGSRVLAITEDRNGTFIGGEFEQVGSSPRNGIARLRSDGAVDPGFNPGAGADAAVRAIAVLSDGKVLVGGSFTLFDGEPREHLVRLHADGSVDETFESHPDGAVRSIAVLPDGRIAIGGSFTNVNGFYRIYIAVLHEDGAVDTSFEPPGDNLAVDGTGIFALAPSADGKIIAVSDWINLHMGRFLPNGERDWTFQPNPPSGSYIYAFALQPDGKIIVGGDFPRLADPGCCTLHTRSGIARINRDGSVDTGFNPGSGAVPANVRALCLQSDLRVVVGGTFTNMSGVARRGLARLHGDIRTRIESWELNESGQLNLTVTNEPGRVYVIEASTNMIGWFPVATNTPALNTFTYGEASPAGGPARSYRVIQVNP